MSIIAEFEVPATDFELGQILAVEELSTIELESLVPVGTGTVPLFWIHNSTRESFVKSIQGHGSVNSANAIDEFEDRTLFTLDWDANQDSLFSAIETTGGQLLSAIGTADRWKFELRFSDHQSLSGFRERCDEMGIAIKPTQVYNPTSPEAGPWYGLTEPQREALVLAVGWGYYDIPRGCTTKELADELGISDQAVTERLRRAIGSLVTNTVMTGHEEKDSPRRVHEGERSPR